MSKESGLTVPQLLCVRAVEASDADEVTLAAVADSVHLSRSTVSNIVERLVQAGLLDRVRSARDRRRIHLSLTAAGAATLATTPRPLQERFLERLAALEPIEQERLLSALEQVVDLMDAEELDDAPMHVSGVGVSSGA